MAQSIQIAPKYVFPHVETVINDYTVVNDDDMSNVTSDTAVRYIFPFVSSKGIDNRFIRKRTRLGIASTFGETNHKKYGQPLMQALHVAEASNAEVWCMRVMPDDATYAHNIISAYYKADTAEEVAKASERKFRIMYKQRTAPTGVTNIKDLFAEAMNEGPNTVDGVDADTGYNEIPGVITMYSVGRGQYGNNYRVRMTQDASYEKDYGIKYYNYEVLSTERGLNKEATYTGSNVTSAKYNSATFISDILEDTDEGSIPVVIKVDEAGIEDLYYAFTAWLADLVPELQAEMESADEATKKSIENLIKLATVEMPDIDEFDAIFGRNVASTKMNPFMAFPTGDDVIDWGNLTGAVTLAGGSDGTALDTKTSVTLSDGTIVENGTYLDQCYVNAFSGVYDKRILTAKRIKANALWDANYSMIVKTEMANLAMLRNDAVCYLDCGIMESFGGATIANLITDYSVFDDHKISKNVHHYYIKEETTKKRVPVTITYFLARQYADHVMNFGSHIPFVKSYAQLTGHVKDSLAPSLEDFETELKETLTENRFNFFETIDENVYQRATQNTAQENTSDLLEEHNVTTLYEMKRIVEADIVDRLYDFTDSDARERFRNYERAKFADWSGREVESFDIDFRMSNWEAERSILHAYLDVTFRGIQKRAILEIDINKRASVEAASN